MASASSSSSSQISPRFVIFVVVSLLTHLMDVAASALFCHMLTRQDQLKTPWFSISAGLLIIPLVGLQLISAVFLLRRKGDSSTTVEVTLTAILHVLQLGFISRHFAILQESSIPSKKYEINEMLVLRLVFSLTCGLPLLLIKLHVLFQGEHEASWDWTLYLTSATALLATTWALATFRRHLSESTIDSLLIAFPGTVLKIFWRAGEITTRVVALSLFASIYSYWLFLVIGLHWFAMLVCVCVPAITPIDLRPSGFAYRLIYSLVASFTYIFVFINTTCENTVFRYTFYYIIFFLENTTLVTVWSVQASSEDHEKHVAFVYVSAISFTISIISMIVYYKFFHLASPKETASSSSTCGSPGCASCKLDIGNTHPPIPPRPGATGHWLSQYHSSIYCGQYCKHVGNNNNNNNNHGQDSLLDSTSEKNSVLTVSSSHARIQQKLGAVADDDADGRSSSCKKSRQHTTGTQVDSSTSEQRSASPRSKPRKKNKKKSESSGKKDSEKNSSSGGKGEGNLSEGSGSQKQPVWLPSGDSNFANQLLTYSLETFDTNDTADDERSSVATGVQGGHFRREISSRDTSVHKQMDRHWYSDGYSTDRTLDVGNFPVSPRQRNRFNSSLESDEERLNCHECSHGDSEVSSIMRSIDDGPSGRRSREISPRERATEGHRKHHHHNNHHHHHHHDHNHQHHRHHRQSRNSDSHPPETPLSVSLKDSIKTHGLKSHRTHILSSPASDPSHGPKPKRMGSPKRRVHGSAHPDRSATRGPPTTPNQSTELNSHAHHQNPTSKLRISPIDDRIAQSEQFARELLSKSSTKSKKLKNSASPSSNAAAADPRFNVRVMVSDAQDSPRDKHPQHQPENELLTASAREGRRDAGGPAVVLEEKRKILGVTEKETDVDRFALSGDDDDRDGNLIVVSRSPREISISGDQPSYRSTGSSDVQTSSSENSPHSDSAVDKDEAIYENIWQVKQDGLKSKGKSKSKVGTRNRAFVEEELSKMVSPRSLSSGGREAWYMCSESEDSALPPEILSSSVDGFTASENGSDVSEIVI